MSVILIYKTLLEVVITLLLKAIITLITKFKKESNPNRNHLLGYKPPKHIKIRITQIEINN